MEIHDKIDLIDNVKEIQNKPEDIILNKSEPNIPIKEQKNKNNNLLITKKSPSPHGKIRAYKNKYNSPEINRLKETDKNKVLLDIKHFKNKNNSSNDNKVEELNIQHNFKNAINTLNSQNISKRILLKEKVFDIIDKGIEDDNVRLTDNNMEKRHKLNCMKDLNLGNLPDENVTHFSKKNRLKRSNSSNEFDFENKKYLSEFNNFQFKEKEFNCGLMNINFPKHIVKNHSIEIVSGKYNILNPNHNNKNLLINNSDRQIINQENIIINNGFVNMNNNYYVNNNLNNGLNKIDDNNNFVNNNINDIKFNNNNINYKNDFMYNSNNYLQSKLFDLDIINKQSNDLLNDRFNNNYIGPNKLYISPKNINKINNPEEFRDKNFSEFNPKHNQKDNYEENYANNSKEGNFNLEEDHIEPNYINNIPDIQNDLQRISNFNKKFNNNFSRNENIPRPIPNPQYFHPNFHPDIPFKYISVLQIQYPIQMMVKRTKNFQKVKNKLIKYYPPKVQLEMRPCLIFQPLFIKKRKNPHKKIPNNKKVLKKKIKHKRPVFKIPPSKKVSLSQGKNLNFIHKYYDENFILEEDNEEESKALKDIFLTNKNTELENQHKTDINCMNENIKEKNYFSDENLKNKNNNNIQNKENNESEIKKKNEIIINNNKNIEDKKNIKQIESKKTGSNGERKIITKQRYINRMKIPIKNDDMNKKNKTDKIYLINIKKQKKSPFKGIVNNKKNINTIFSLNEVKQRFNILNYSARINSTSLSIDKSRENIYNKNKVINMKNNSKNKNIKIINYIPRNKKMKKSNSFFCKKIVERIYSKKSNNILNNSYKNISRKRLAEKNNINMSQKNRIIKIDLSKI